MRFVLGSGSPRRKELLSYLGFEYDIIKAVGEEEQVGDTPAEIVEHLSKQKAAEVAAKVSTMPEYQNDEVMVFGADTLVAFHNQILGKPKDEKDAIAMLEMLSGEVHQVYTGVTVAIVANQDITYFTFHECSEVEFYPVSKEEILEYVATKDPFDKAGSYAIQGEFGKHVKGIRGDYNNIVGLPVARLYQELKERNLVTIQELNCNSNLCERGMHYE